MIDKKEWVCSGLTYCIGSYALAADTGGAVSASAGLGAVDIVTIIALVITTGININNWWHKRKRRKKEERNRLK